MHDRFDDLLFGATDVARAVKMHLELRRGVAQRGERRDDDQFPGLEIKAGA